MARESLSAGDREQALARLATVLRGLEARRPGGGRPEAIPSRTWASGGGGDPQGEVSREVGGEGGVLTGWSGIDALGGLSRGLLHEWFGVAEPGSLAAEEARGAAEGPGPEDEDGVRPPRRGRGPSGRPQPWTPPLRLFAALATRSMASSGGAGGGWVCWIGAKVWPYPRALIPRAQLSTFESASAAPVGSGDDAATPRPSRRAGVPVVPVSPDLLASSLFIDPPDDAVRLWAIDLALRCPALAAVVADGRGLTMPASRRLQLAAEKSATGGGGPLVLLARPPSERGTPSVAGTRWLVEREAGSPSASSPANPRWCVEVLRWKGRGAVLPSRAASGRSMGATGEVGRRWSLEWSHVESAVLESPVVVDGSRASPGDPPYPGARIVQSSEGRSSECLEARAPHDGFERGNGRAAAG